MAAENDRQVAPGDTDSQVESDDTERRVKSDDTDNQVESGDTERRTLLNGEGYALEPGCTRAEFLAVAKVYARAVVEAFDLTVTVSDLDWEVSLRAKRRAGAVRYRNGEPQAVVLTWEQFEREGWTAMAGTIRHELVHVHLLNEGVEPGHCDQFRELAAELEAPVRCDRFARPKWWVVCRDCGGQLARYRRSKLVTHPEKYCCGECGGALVVQTADRVESS